MPYHMDAGGRGNASGAGSQSLPVMAACSVAGLYTYGILVVLHIKAKAYG